MSKNKKKEKRQRPELGIWGFILALMGLMLVAAFLKDSQGAAFGASLSIIWAYVAIVTFILGLVYFAQFVAPMRGDYGWWEGLRMIMRAYVVGVTKDIIRPAKDKKKQTAGLAAEWPPSLQTLRAGPLRSYQVMAITKGKGFVRAMGPGFVNLYNKEEIREMVDLRTQLRHQAVQVHTRDGIAIETKVTVIFRVKQAPDRQPPGMLHPYDPDAIFHLTYLYTVDAMGVVSPWPEQIAPHAAGLLVQELSLFELNSLIHFPATAVSPLEDISQRVHNILRGQFDARGVDILVVKAGPLKLPEKVQEQNVQTWCAEWDRRMAIEKGSNEAEVIRRIKQARARAQVEIIETIIQNLETMRRDGESDLYQVIILRLIDALEEAVASDSPRMFVPQQIMAGLLAETSAQVRSRLNDPLLPSGLLDNDGEGERPS